MSLRESLIEVLESGMTVKTLDKYCYKTAKGKFLAGSDFCRSFDLPDDSQVFLDTAAEAADHLLGADPGKAGCRKLPHHPADRVQLPAAPLNQ